MFNKFLIGFDRIICRYLGLNDNEFDRPNTIKRANGNIFVLTNYPFKRHRFSETILQFSERSAKITNKRNKQKIGVAAGKSIANNLIITFEDIDIKNTNE